MIQLTKRGDYGVLAVYYLTQYPKGRFISIDEIAAKSQIPKPYLSKILQDLCRGGILLSRRGTGGGFTLARPAQKISLRDIIEIIEGKLSLVTCLGAPDLCIRSTDCIMTPFWEEVQGFIDEITASITLAELIDPEKRQNLLMQLQSCRKQYKENVIPKT